MMNDSHRWKGRRGYGRGDFFVSSVDGTIFSCEKDENSGLFHSFILTSADVIRRHYFTGGEYRPSMSMWKNNGEANSRQKVHVKLHTSVSYRGEVVAFDHDYNLAVVKIESGVELSTASLMLIDDRVSIGFHESSRSSGTLDVNPNYVKMIPGDEVIVVGRRSNRLICCRGKYSVDYLGPPYDFENLFRINCRPITNGGPVINFGGNVIGIAFGCSRCTAFLPINQFLNWWMHFRRYKEIRRPSVGIMVANLFTAHTRILEPTVNFHGITDGVVVEEVETGTPAYVAGIRRDDVIFRCGGRFVRSFLEFSQLIWEKKGEVVEIMGVRCRSECSWTMKIDIVKPEIGLDNATAGYF